jgi:hypothetical protein
MHKTRASTVDRVTVNLIDSIASSLKGNWMIRTRLLGLALVVGLTSVASANPGDFCVAVAADVSASISAEVMKADALYARADFSGAFEVYARAYATSKDVNLLYAQAMAKLALGVHADARALFDAYLKTGGALAFRAQAEAHLRELGGPLPVAGGLVGGVVGGVGGVVGGVTGHLPGGGVVGGVAGGAVGGIGVGGDITAKPKKVAGTAAIVLGVVAVAAIATLGIHSLAAGISDNISMDPKFDLSLGITGVSVGITAIYLSGLTVAAGAAGGVCGVASLPPHTPMVAPVALPGGGGFTAALTF